MLSSFAFVNMADDDSGQPKNRHLPQSNADEKNGDIANPIKVNKMHEVAPGFFFFDCMFYGFL